MVKNSFKTGLYFFKIKNICFFGNKYYGFFNAKEKMIESTFKVSLYLLIFHSFPFNIERFLTVFYKFYKLKLMLFPKPKQKF